jgi:hypothetical protein
MKLMSGVEAALLIGIAWTFLMSIITWRAFRPRVSETDSVSTENRVDILLVLLVIAAFALGGFLTYALLLSI